ncbi:MAG: rhodanese-like domain-containing protein [Pseudomonadota bacterium]
MREVSRSAAVAALLFIAFLPFHSAQALDRLIKPDAAIVATDQQSINIIDIRHKKLGFERGHIPGSVSMPYWDFRSKNGALVSDPEMTQMAQQAGLRKNKPVLIVHSGMDHRSFSSAAWVYWMLKSTGFTDISILDGGIKAWKEAGGEISHTPRKPKRSAVVLTFSDEWLASTEEVQRISDGDQQGALLDSRVEESVNAGSIQGAMSYAVDMLLQKDRREALDPLDTLEKLKAVQVNWEGDPVITFCNDGTQGAATWFMASEIAGIKKVRLYAESLQGWEKRNVN